MAKQSFQYFHPVVGSFHLNNYPLETPGFFEEELGFEIEILQDKPPYAVVARGQTIIEFGEGRKEYAGSGVCVIFVSNVDTVYNEYIANRDYGSRDFRIKDNNGNVLIFSSPLIDQKELIDAGNTVERQRQG